MKPNGRRVILRKGTPLADQESQPGRLWRDAAIQNYVMPDEKTLRELQERFAKHRV